MTPSNPLLEKIARNFSGESVATLSEPCILIWKREDQYLLVDYSASGFFKALKHPIIGQVERLRKRDTIECFSVKGLTSNDVVILRAQLIKRYSPKYNLDTSYQKLKKDLPCRTCGNLFDQKRWWQRDCQKCKA